MKQILFVLTLIFTKGVCLQLDQSVPLEDESYDNNLQTFIMQHGSKQSQNLYTLEEGSSWLILFKDKNNKICRRYPTLDMEILQKKSFEPIAFYSVVDCSNDNHRWICDFLEPKTMPYVMLFKDTHIFELPIQTSNDYTLDNIEQWTKTCLSITDQSGLKQIDKFLNERHKAMMKNQPTFVPSDELFEITEAQELFWGWEMVAPILSPLQYHFEIPFDYWFRGAIVSIFSFLGLDHYSKFTKVTLFILLLLIPSLLFILNLIFSYISDWCEKPPKVVPAAIIKQSDLDAFELAEKLKNQNQSQYEKQKEYEESLKKRTTPSKYQLQEEKLQSQADKLIQSL